ncbi:UNVERIFIED_CONTAM: putative disease resistance RPP8-like protein 2 [Sesamum calycinum]|uniref:Disease resistance RPP8-like protein 2 n=1 Tax=Sesamum calycinum TaxID=2727403 RepID=A0AAW2NE87_9LAMI
MAVAAYAALLSLSHVLENVQLPARRSRLHLDTQQLQSLQEKVEFLRNFLELDSQKSQEMEDLGRQISIVADEAEDIIDLHVVYQLGEGSRDHKSDPMAALSSFCQDIDRVVEKIDSIMKGLTKMEEEWGAVLEEKPVASLLPSSSTRLSRGKNTMVGFDEYLLRILDELTRDDSDLLILPIVGMGGSYDHYLTINLLNEDKSWNLFCEKVFAQEECPYPELEKIGKSIVERCNGLPLAIVVIGGLLAKCNMTQEYWEFVVKNLTSFANLEADEHCSRVLSLSYNHLPLYLKPCFLYWRVFPEDHLTYHPDLIKLWLVEGFLKPLKGKTLEETAEEYLKELIDRNLIRVIDEGPEYPPGLVMHDLLRDLCLRECQKQHFILVPRTQHVTFDGEGIQKCFVCCNKSTLESIDLPEVNVASQSTSLTLIYVQNFRCTDEVIKRIPNIKKLHIAYSESDIEGSNYCLYNLALLCKLESLVLMAQNFLVEHIAFPSSLKRLQLFNCRIPWEHMTIIGSLPNLKELYVFQYAFEGPEWNPVEGEFPRLEELMIVKSNLVWWRAENIHFPNLKLLQLYFLHKLQEIPLSIGDIATLQKIVLCGGKKSAEVSAKQIAEEQHNNGNESLQVYVDGDKVIVS